MSRVLSVLLVEDEPACRYLAATALGSRGHRVRVAVDQGEALAAFVAEVYDLVLMDLGLPGGDIGLLLTRVLRRYEEPLGRRTPVVAVTAATSARDRRRCRSAGMDGFVRKPYPLRILFTAIDAALSRPHLPH